MCIRDREYVIPTYGVWDTFEKIDFESLPEQFVLKCTHDSGGLVICDNKRKLNLVEAKVKLNKSLKHNYYLNGREWPYKDVKPRIIAEKYMVNDSKWELTDYNIHFFNGAPQFILVCSQRFSDEGIREDFYSVSWERLDIERPTSPNSEKGIGRPDNLNEMIDLAKCLSANIPFVRTDFYVVHGRIYFGELTFYPSSGFEKFKPDGCDLNLGNLLSLPKKDVYKRQIWRR